MRRHRLHHYPANAGPSRIRNTVGIRRIHLMQHSARWHAPSRWLYAIRLALFAILLNAVGPTFSQLHAARQPDLAATLTICSVDSTRAVQLTQRGRALNLLQLLSKPCPLCALQLGPGLLPMIWQLPVLSLQALVLAQPTVSNAPQVSIIALPPARGPPAQN